MMTASIQISRWLPFSTFKHSYLLGPLIKRDVLLHYQGAYLQTRKAMKAAWPRHVRHPYQSRKRLQEILLQPEKIAVVRHAGHGAGCIS